jgi:hypothetical protein
MSQPASDYQDLAYLSQQLMMVTHKLLENAQAVGTARQIREFSSDRRKRALALAVKDVLNLSPDMSATAAENAARAQPGYAETLKKLRDELRMAEISIAENDAFRAQHDSLRSLLSFQKTLTQNL